MSLVSDSFHEKKLNKYKINIKTKYIVGSKILERNTDNSLNDDVKNGIRCEKLYYINDKLQHTEKEFDSRIEYTFISKDEENKNHTCPNCGMESELKEFINDCPYCKTPYNIEYIDKDLGSKYHYDRVLRNNTYRIVTAIIDLIFSLILSFIFIKITSRTFNNYDIYKALIYGIILSLILYYFFYIIDACVILGPIKRYKDKENQKQFDFWNKTKIDKKTFFNNFNYEISKFYYCKNNIIDYDILDYFEFKEHSKNNNQYIEVLAEIRLVFFKNNKITSKIIKEKYIMKRHEKIEIKLKPGANIIKCHNCGAAVDIALEQCSYCNTPISSFQEWTMENTTRKSEI